MSSETVISEAVIANILNAINDLTSKVDFLTVGKTAEPSVEDDQHISASIPVTVLNVYPELESLFPSMPEDFYRTMIIYEEKKEAIYGCPKSREACYNPPPINEAAPGSAKKADAAFYAIQVAQAHGTRPIDYFIRRMPQSNPNLTLDDPVVGVLNTIRCIIENTASMTAQARLENLHSGMSFTVKHEQVVESEVKPQMDSEKFDTQLAAIKPTKRARVRRPFCGHRQIEGRPSPQQDRLRIPPMGGFRGEPGAEVERTINGFNFSSGWRAPLGVQTSLNKAHGQSVGPEHRGEGIPSTFQEIGIEQQGLRGDPMKSFYRAGPLVWPKATQEWPASTKRIERFDEGSAASPKSDTYGASSTDNAPYALQEEAQHRDLPDPHGRGGGFNNEESHRGCRESEIRILQKFILHPKEDRRTTPSIGSKVAEPAPGGKELR
ncbi:hypothetical protein AYI69_g9554 [Smittium culicis]|uniref:Uncharacterized protein n=1 Tax=Smittium culicis TaxID=133412 RepID=A0A1R1XBW0_9FUNG|nr:hypothetical protein AYI69_g9554 [Smittium culicis]